MKRTDARLLLPALALLARPRARGSRLGSEEARASPPMSRPSGWSSSAPIRSTLAGSRSSISECASAGSCASTSPGRSWTSACCWASAATSAPGRSRASERRAGRLLGRVQGPPPRDTARLRHRRRPDRSRHAPSASSSAARDEGQTGLHVVFLQHRLRDLRYVVGPLGHLRQLHARAVMAYRKVTGMNAALQRQQRRSSPAGARRRRFRDPVPAPRQARRGRPVAPGARAVRRSGKRPGASTGQLGQAEHADRPGPFRVYSKTPGTNSKGMVNSNYFIGGYAIHGYPDVPDVCGQPRLPARPDPERAVHVPLAGLRRRGGRLPLEARRRRLHARHRRSRGGGR